ncbi:KRRI-Interacting protein 1, partial [Borealophlyctis nickersoniae]
MSKNHKKLINLLEDEEDEPELRINEKFAKQYEAKKKHEEFTSLREKYGDDYLDEDEGPPDSESEEEEDEFGELVTPEVDAQFMKTLAKLRAKKEEVYDPNSNFFSEEQIKKAQEEWKEKQKKLKEEKPVRLKDFHRQKLLEGGAEADEEENGAPQPLSHAEEQEKLKQELKAAFHAFGEDEDEDGEFMTIRQKSKDELEREEEEYRNFLLESMASEGGEALEDWRSFSQVKDDPDEAFLMEYILTRGWMEKGAKKVPTYDQVIDDSEDEEIVEAAEDFERQHNFRYEEEGSTTVITHARNIEGTLRRKDDRRKREREARAQRKEEEKRKKDEELKRLKNLKMEEIRSKLKQIQEIAGGDVVGFDAVDLEKEYDPEDYDRKMATAFGDSYYTAEDATVKPDFGDDIDISDLVGGDEEEQGASKKRKRGNDDVDMAEAGQGPEDWIDGGDDWQWPPDAEQGGDEDFNMDADYMPGGEYYGEEVAEEDADGKGGKTKKDKKGKKGKEKLSVDEYMDEYYQLDYEDMIGDLPTRFKYRQVAPETFGLKPEEILDADDADLNNLISLKKLAPFRRRELVEKDSAKWSKSRKKRLKEFRKTLEAKRKGEVEAVGGK